MRTPVEALPLPSGVRFTPFDYAVAQQCRALMDAAYSPLGDPPVVFETWYRSLVRDEEYDPSLVWVVLDDDRVVGFCQCWTSAFIKDVVVDAAWRGRGVGAALVTTALAAFAGRNVPHVDLKTDAGNHAALSLYRRLGFEIVED